MVALKVANVPEEERYEAKTSDGDLVGYLTYRVLGRLVVLIAIEVEPQYQTSDVESEILTAAMNDIRERELLMLPVADVVQSFLELHPEHLDLVPEEPTGTLASDTGDGAVARVDPELLGDLEDEPVDRVEQAEESRKRLGSAVAGGEPATTGVTPRKIPALLAATIVVGVVVVVVALLAMVLLPRQSGRSAWTPVLQDLLTTAYQALAIGALGGMAKLLIDRRKSHEAAAAELRDRQRGYITSTVNASHQVDNARMLIQATGRS